MKSIQRGWFISAALILTLASLVFWQSGSNQLEGELADLPQTQGSLSHEDTTLSELDENESLSRAAVIGERPGLNQADQKAIPSEPVEPEAADTASAFWLLIQDRELGTPIPGAQVLPFSYRGIATGPK